jgi:hypothetical protein
VSKQGKSGTLSCAFCGRPWSVVPRSKEHIWPRWIRKHATDFAPGHFDHALGFGLDEKQKAFVESQTVTRFHKSSILTAQTREVCEPCNNGWMSTLETQAEPLFLRLLEAATSNQRCRLTFIEAATLARWMQKTAMANELTIGLPSLMPVSLRQRLRDEDRPLVPAYVWVGRFPENKEMMGIQVRFKIGNTRIPDPRHEDRVGLLSGLAFRSLLLMAYIPSSRRHEAPRMPVTSWTLLSPISPDSAVEYPPPVDLTSEDVRRLTTDYSSWLPLSDVSTFVRNPNPPTIHVRN